MGSKMIDIKGKRYGRLTVISVAYLKNKRYYWLCRCDCGTEKAIASHAIINFTRSCGCLNKEVNLARLITHGGSDTPEYGVWSSIKDRCLNPKNKRYPDWGGRGITMCDRWKNSFSDFLADMGKKPTPQHSIERRDNDKGYEQSNCYWATRDEQGKNKRNNIWLEFNNEKMIIADWARRFGLTYSCLYQKLQVTPFSAIASQYN